MDTFSLFWDYLHVSPKYLPALVDNVSNTFLYYICLCTLMLLLSWNFLKHHSNTKPPAPAESKTKKKTQTKGNFDISPEDEVIFQSTVSQEEIEAEIAKNTPGTYIPLDPSNMKKQINDFVGTRNKDDLIQRVKRSRQQLRNKVATEMSDEDKINEAMVQQQQMAKIFSLLKDNEDKFGKMTKDDLKQQMKLYE